MKTRQFILIFLVLLVMCGELFVILNYSKKTYNQLDGTNYILVEMNQTLNDSDIRMKNSFGEFETYLKYISDQLLKIHTATNHVAFPD